MIDGVQPQASIGPVNAMVVAGVVHSCSREVIGVNIIRPIGINVGLDGLSEVRCC